MNCCDPSGDGEWKERQAEEKKALETPISIDGVALKVKDLFPDYWAAKEFLSKLNLIKKVQGGSGVDVDKIETELFSNGKEMEDE